MTLRGMTRDHPRAWLALEAFVAVRRGPSVRWNRQSLADFEAYPIDELAQCYDLMVIDHPGLPAALHALTPIDDIFDAAVLTSRTDSAIGVAELVPRAGGQAAHRAVWDRGGPFYGATRNTLTHAWVHTKVAGWIEVQDRLSERAPVTRSSAGMRVLGPWPPSTVSGGYCWQTAMPGRRRMPGQRRRFDG